MTRKPPNGAQHQLFPDDAGPTIHRARHLGHFTTLSNEGANDPRLSADTRGVLWWLLTKPDDWKIIWSVIAKVFGFGHTAVERIRRELQDGGYLRHKQAKAQKGQFTPVQYHLFEAPTEERGGESHESHDDQSQPWIAGGISRATWFRQKAGNPSAAETPTASRKTPSGETQRSAGISGNGEAGNPCATDSLTATPKPTSGETHCAAGGVSHRDEGNPCATDSLTATPFTAQRLSRSPANGALLNTKKRLKTEKDQGEGASPPGPPHPTPSGDSTGGEKRAGRRAQVAPLPAKTAMPPDLVLNEAMLSFATTRGMSPATVDYEFQRFVNYYLREGKLSASWEASWRTWVLNHFRFKQSDAEKAAAERSARGGNDMDGVP